MTRSRLLSSCIALFLAVAAVPAHAAATPDRSTPAGQRDLTVLSSFFMGNWDAKPGEPQVRLRVAEFWKGSPVRWFYLEWVRLGDDAKPVRQRVLRVAEGAEEHFMAATMHRLPDGGAKHVGEWGKREPFASLEPTDFPEIEGCELKVVRTMTAHFTLTTNGEKCPGDLPQGPFMRFEFSIASSEMALLEQPRDAEGKVPKSRLEPYQFGRMARAPQ